MNNTNDIVIVNYDDEQIGKTSKQEAHEKGLLHRAFSIYIVNEKNEILLQKRNINKYHSGGLWTNTCCSHPASDCNLLEFASERLQEEFGIKSDLEEIGQFVYRNQFDNNLTEYEYDHILFGQVKNISVFPNPEEIDDFSWCSIDAVENLLLKEPEVFTAWFLPSFFIFKKFMNHRP